MFHASQYSLLIFPNTQTWQFVCTEDEMTFHMLASKQPPKYDLMSDSLGSEAVQVALSLHSSFAKENVSEYYCIWHSNSRYILTTEQVCNAHVLYFLDMGKAVPIWFR